ncbi:hypothetical protein BCV70DRAFT_647 [Testicularia cyperi]|uniref:Uncharacterized protein n=1 Tax=Testicularia cyperi TaxID=1882483 RepID=A0A317XVY1_9BASI|nr:hypothetical protein BCV70DRAFT_647 [Testicularia cyperi]
MCLAAQMQSRGPATPSNPVQLFPIWPDPVLYFRCRGCFQNRKATASSVSMEACMPGSYQPTTQAVRQAKGSGPCKTAPHHSRLTSLNGLAHGEALSVYFTAPYCTVPLIACVWPPRAFASCLRIDTHFRTGSRLTRTPQRSYCGNPSQTTAVINVIALAFAIGMICLGTLACSRSLSAHTLS